MFQWLRRIRAWLLGYYWERCALCDRWYGGNEHAETSVVTMACRPDPNEKVEGLQPALVSKGRMVCWRCEDRAAQITSDRLNALFASDEVRMEWLLPPPQNPTPCSDDSENSPDGGER